MTFYVRSKRRHTALQNFVPVNVLHTEVSMYNHKTVHGIRSGADGTEVVKMHAVARIMLNNHIPNIQVSWVKEGARLSRSCCSGSRRKRFCRHSDEPEYIDSSRCTAWPVDVDETVWELIEAAGRIPIQRSTTYRTLKVFVDENEDPDSSLDSIDSSQFGSYHELIKLDKFRYKDAKSNGNI